MIDLTTWMPAFLTKLDATFGSRVWFMGLQGSYGRGEATETSDLDLVVILDALTAGDIQRYSQMLDTLPQRQLLCGFLSDKNTLAHWEPSDLFQLYFDTTPIRGSMDALIPLLDQSAVERAVKIGACNIYHMCVHNMVHGKNEKALLGLYKNATFVVQAFLYLQTGGYIRRRQDLLAAAEEKDRAILETYDLIKNGGQIRLQEMSEKLFAWCQSHIS